MPPAKKKAPAKKRAAPKKSSAKPRKPIAWRPVLWTLFFVNLVLGLMMSAATSATKIRVIGAPTTDESRLRQILGSLKDRPSMKVDKRAVESLVLSGSDIDRASFSLNLFGRGILRLKAKVPVARMRAPYPLYLSDQGDLFVLDSAIAGVPLVQVDEGVGMNLSYMSGWEPGPVALLAKRIQADFPRIRWTIRVKSGGKLGLNMDDGGVIIIGDSSELDRKLRVLKQILQDQPGILQEVKEINLTAPDQPAIRR